MPAWINNLARYKLQIWAVVIAFALWLQVHGQGAGSLSMDIPLQVEGLPTDMVIINDLPDHVRITITGLQSRLKELRQKDIIMPIDTNDITTPGVVERSLQPSAISLPVGLHIEKVQPDRLELQIDKVVTKWLPVRPNVELPADWQVESLSSKPQQVQLIGPEVWLEALQDVESTPIRPQLKIGFFKTTAGVESPAGKAIRLTTKKLQVTIQGILVHKRTTPEGDQ